jgi:FkbM family methyltransferase
MSKFDIAGVKALRRVALPLMARINIGDIKIKHHYTGDKIKIHPYKHKGYWYYGKKREEDTMNLFCKIIKTNDNVIEVGGHIGYISLLFSTLVGDGGKVHVFEPGINNLPYLRFNTAKRSNVTIIPKAAGNINAKMPFYMENVSGQNNSLVKDFEIFNNVKRMSYNKKATITEVEVEVVRVDNYAKENSITPDFIKIDAEGFEFEILKGISNIIEKHCPAFMIAIQENNRGDIFKFITDRGYMLYNDHMERLCNDKFNTVNTFILHSDKHKHLINK